MGTNYYMIDACPHCGRYDERAHIGKSSGGLVFALHVYPAAGINTWADWLVRLVKPGIIIKNEYGEAVGVRQMQDIVTKRQWWNNGGARSAQWYAENHAEPGPNGLARSRVDGRHCIGHGDGTWSYYVGEFS